MEADVPRIFSILQRNASPLQTSFLPINHSPIHSKNSSYATTTSPLQTNVLIEESSSGSIFSANNSFHSSAPSNAGVATGELISVSSKVVLKIANIFFHSSNYSLLDCSAKSSSNQLDKFYSSGLSAGATTSANAERRYFTESGSGIM